MPVVPLRVERPYFLSISSILPAAFVTLITLSETVATPAESYPLYSTRFSPRSRIGATASSFTQPIIPHMVAGSARRLKRSRKAWFFQCGAGCAWCAREFASGPFEDLIPCKALYVPLMSPQRVMAEEKLLFDPKSQGATALRVLVSDSPRPFAPAFTEVGRKILGILAKGPRYPAQIARELKTHHQTVYYHVGRLKKSGLITSLESHDVRGGRANVYTLSSDGYAVEFDVKGEVLPSISAATRSRAFGNFFNEFVGGGTFNGCIVVKVPNPWDESRTCVICAGVTGAGTKAGILALTTFADDTLKGYKSGRWGGVLRGTDLDGDGKVDSVETLRRI